MASKRAPLADVPNALNSPFRAVNGKRTRAQAGDPREVLQGQPAIKKHIIEANEHDEENVDPRRRKMVAVGALEKLDSPFSKPSSNSQPTPLERKLASVKKEKNTAQQRNERSQKAHDLNLESIRQWQKHYRRQFPGFVFYFESVPDEARSKALRQINSLGAREEKFFSKAVTHVVTTRPIPPDNAGTLLDEDVKSQLPSAKGAQAPLLTQEQRRTTNLLDAHLQRRTQNASATMQPSMETRRLQSHNADFLSRARALGMKIWAWEKMQRVLSTILDTDTGGHGNANESRGPVPTTRRAAVPAQSADLEQLLRNEKVTGPTDRDMTVATQDMIVMQGFYIYVHDMDEHTKPIMTREYSKPATKEDGKWPQFRVSGSGRCPFLGDPAYKKTSQIERDTAKAQNESVQRKTRAGTTLQAPAALAEREPNLRRSPRKRAAGAESLDPPKILPIKRQSSEIAPAHFGSTQFSLRGLPRMVGGEPIASGVQPSNVTSAIRSQAISSAAISSTAPTFSRRFPDTREVNILNRKVFERAPTVTSNHNAPSSYMNDVRAAINDDQAPPPRAAKRKAQETLGVVHENDTKHRSVPSKNKKLAEKDPKPGYCENCRDKFDDFDEHIVSRKHRKFALTQENWDELDFLLSKLKRPHKAVGRNH